MLTYTFWNIRQYGLYGIAHNGEYPLVPFLLILLGCAVAAYLLGSLNFAVILSRRVYHEDIRKRGSGNGGMTNMMRSYGKKAAALTLLLDALKAVLAVGIGALVAGEAGGYIAGLGCVLGHVFPLYFHFRGGKGVVVTAAMILCLEPVAFLILFLLFVAIVLMTRYISLGSVMCMLVYPLFLNRLYASLHHQPPGATVTLVSFAVAVLVIFLHRSNIRRLMNGEENKFSFKKSVKAGEQKDNGSETEEDHRGADKK